MSHGGSRLRGEYDSLVKDANGNVAKRVTDEVNATKLDEVKTKLDTVNSNLGGISTTLTDGTQQTKITNSAGDTLDMEPTGVLNIGEQTNLLGGVFDNDPLTTQQFTASVTGSGAQSVANARLTLSTGTTADSGVSVQTNAKARLIAGTWNTFFAEIDFPVQSVTNNVVRFGVFNPQDATSNGYFFENDGGSWFIVSRLNNVDTRVAEGSWNGPQAANFVKDTNARNYRIKYSQSHVFFYQNGSLLHQIHIGPTVSSGRAHLKIGVRNFNKNGSTTNRSVRVGALAVHTFGKPRGLPRPTLLGGGTTTLKQGPGYLQNILYYRDGGIGGNGSLTVYDNTTATGTPILRLIMPGNDYRNIPIDLVFSVGLTVVVGTSATQEATVIWD